MKVGERPDTFWRWASSRQLTESGEPGRLPARPAQAKLKALHVPRIDVPNLLPDMCLRASDRKYLPDIDTIVLQPCDVNGHNRCVPVPRTVAFGLVRSVRMGRGGIT